jgi:hypothetical protein
MHRILKRRPTPAMGVALVALFAALSGIAIAGPSIPGSGRVHSADIHNGQVKRADIGTNAVNGSKVANNSLTGADVLESSLGRVPSANTANSASTANTASTATTANTASTATTANTASTATTANTANSVAANGVNTAAIQNDAVTNAKIADGAVTNAKIADGAVTNAKIADDAVTSPKIAADAVGASELKGTYAAVSGGTPAAADTFVDAAAVCNSGDAVLGGGFAWLNDADEIETVYSTPDPLANPNQWIVRSRSGAANTLFAWAVCLAA